MKTVLIILFTFLCICANCQSNEKELLGGCWFIPHNATINIKFEKNHHFVFNDFNVKKEKEERLTGKYLLSDNTLYLNYDDRPKQRVQFYKRKANDNYVIVIKASSKEYSDKVFLHGECE